jgi:hypothetical protein
MLEKYKNKSNQLLCLGFSSLSTKINPESRNPRWPFQSLVTFVSFYFTSEKKNQILTYKDNPYLLW